ncbi:hypothetical protein ACFQ6B_24370 [Streptomyces wedmorensis]|uniref:Uncharacterized protein n=1 Tax=Streptomyces wedmorensis TaxID=43759 RepID=A0ABW6J5V9_STRWE
MARNSHPRNTSYQLARKRPFLLVTNLAATAMLALVLVSQAAPAAENSRNVASAATDGALVLEDLIWG